MIFLKLRLVRYLITISRFIYFRLINNFKFYNTNNKFVKKGTIERNYKSIISFRDCYSGERSTFFLKNLNLIFNKKKIKNMKVLLVGPRNEGEIFNFMSNNFLSKNIDAIDLVSYSKKIKVFDMHKIDLLKKNYDLIYFGFVLNYSKKINDVIINASKKLNKNGYVGISNEYDNIPLMNKTKKKIHLNRVKKSGYEFLVPLRKNHFLNKKINKKFKIIFFKNYQEKLGIYFDKRKCMSLLLVKK